VGRNWSVLSEELADELESYRSKQLSEVSSISTGDSNLKRCCHRLSLLAAAGITEAAAIANKYRLRTRSILEVFILNFY